MGCNYPYSQCPVPYSLFALFSELSGLYALSSVYIQVSLANVKYLFSYNKLVTADNWLSSDYSGSGFS